MTKPRLSPLIFLLSVTVLFGCKTKADLRREQELERIKQEVTQAKGERADFEVVADELRTEISRLNALVSERAQYQDRQFEHIKSSINAVQARLQALEQKAVSEELASVQGQPRTEPPASRREAAQGNLDEGRKAFEDGNFDTAIELLKGAAKSRPNSDEGRKAQYLLAESYYAAKDFATAALEFGEYKKLYPKDPLVPTAIYRQANAFRNLGRSKESRLFYQELLDKFPKHPLVNKAKQEMKKLQ